MKAYPYGVTYADDETLRNLQDELNQLSGSRFPYLRGDWFVATASRPPLYDQLLNLPDSLVALAHNLHVIENALPSHTATQETREIP